MDLDRINELGFEKSSRWKSIVLVLSFSLWWNFFIACQCYLLFLLCTFQLGFHYDNDNIVAIRYTIDVFYLVDVICILAYLRKSEYRKLKYAKVRSWFFICLDILSLIPLELVYLFHYVTDYESTFVSRLLLQNRLLRIYRIFQLETFYEVSVRKTSQFLVYMFLQYFTKALLLGHIGSCIWTNISHSVPCFYEHNADCYIWEVTQFFSLIMLNWSGDRTTFTKNHERVLMSVTLSLGFLLTYIYFYPNTLFVSMQINNSRAVYYEKKEKLRCFLRNMVPSSELREKLTSYFKDVWLKYREDENTEKIFENIPLALQKEIFTDIYWEAFRHSELFREVSRSCKRSLSLVMRTVFFHAGQVIYRKGERKVKMMFLVQGTIQIMAEENEESPVLSFSSGTVMGEFSLFHVCHSQALLKCKSYSELQTLSLSDAVRVLQDYPKDRQLVFFNLSQRLEMAKATQWRKDRFHLVLKMDSLDLGLSNTGVEDCVKWLKTQWRVNWEGHQRHKMIIRAKEEGLRLPSWHRVVKPEVKIEFISNYLDVVVLSDALEERKDPVCLKTKFPWSIDPAAPFLELWRHIVLVTSFVPAIAYPFCSAWVPKFPISIYLASYVVTLIFQIDLSFKILTAIRTKHGIVTAIPSVLFERIQELTFYLDIFAALPYQFYIIQYTNIENDDAYHIGLPLQMAILKMHVFLSLKVPLCDSMVRLTALKHTILNILFIYWFAEIIQLYGVTDLAPTDPINNWIERFLENKHNQDFVRQYTISFIRAICVGVGIPDYWMFASLPGDLVFFCFVRLIFFLFFCFFFGDFYGAHIVKIYAEETFLVLLKRIKTFLQSIYLSNDVAERLVRALKFQWEYDKADYISSKVSIRKSIPKDLQDQIYDNTTLKTLRSCPLLEGESEELIKDIFKASYLVALPSNSTLAMFGQANHLLTVIHRGYCQMTSFMLKDVFKGVGASYAVGPGRIFPVLSAFSNSISVSNVFTITDCELIMVQLNDILALMEHHDDFFRDLVQVAKNQNLVEKLKMVKPGFTRSKKKKVQPEILRALYKEAFLKLGRIGKFLFKIFPRQRFKNIKAFKKWETWYSIYVFFLCGMWPCLFGVMVLFSNYLFVFFIFGKLLLFAHILFRFYAPYYNDSGILVTHPLYTSTYYLKTTFLFDFFTFLPIYEIYRFLLTNPYEKPGALVVLVSFIQHALLINRVIGFISSAEVFLSSKYFIRIVKVFTVFCLSFTYIVNFSMFLAMDWIFVYPYAISNFTIDQKFMPQSPNLVHNTSYYEFFVFTSHWLITSFMTNDFLLLEHTGHILYSTYILAFLGHFIRIYLFTWISSNSIFANITGTIYKEKITSLVKYLEFEKADDKLIEYAISYYNLEWSLTKGENLQSIFQHLPIHLHEELVYPLYRPTFMRNEILCQADESFFKILSTHVSTAYFNRGSVVIFQYECQSDIYFIHRGKCFVYDWFLMLDVGSIVGDLQRTGLMVNKVYALTHVEMLKVPSSIFFNILNDYYELEANFMYRIKNAENFMRVDVPVGDYQLRPVDSRDVLNAFGLQNKDISFEDESNFEDIENTAIQLLKSWKSRPEEKLDRLFIIYPGTWKMTAFAFLYLSISYLTFMLIPTLMNFGTLTKRSMVVVGTLDILWLFCIILEFRVGYIDKVKGDVITDCKFISKQYATKWDGLVIDTVALLPFEMIPIIIAGDIKNANKQLIAWLRVFRLLRGCCIFQHIVTESRKITVNVYIKYIRIILYISVFINFLTNSYIALATEPSIVRARNPFELGENQFFAYVFAYEYILNFMTSANLSVIIPETTEQLIFLNCISVALPCIKGFIISQVLSILFIKKLAMSIYKSQVMALESFLETRDTSSSITKEVLKYKLNLLLFGRSENMPELLQSSPPSLRIAIMKDIYLNHFLKFPLFENLEMNFLKQLVARLVREIYFPGQKIVEQNDVDHRMYFIHLGEVYIINQTKEKAYIEYVIGRKNAGDYFGEAQGLWFSVPHKLTYRARTVVEIVALNARDWIDLRRSFPDIAMKIFRKARSLKLL